MRLTSLHIAIACVAAILSPRVYSQTMIEHAVTAAGGSVAGVAGKGVSDGLDKIFRSVDKQTQKAAGNARDVRRVQSEPAGEALAVPAPAPSAPVARARSTTARVVAPSLPELTPTSGNSATWNDAVSQPEAPAPSLEDLAAVEVGLARGDVISRLGAPAARVIIPEAGHLQEVYVYNSRRTHLGNVTLIDGTVSAVRVEASAQ